MEDKNKFYETIEAIKLNFEKNGNLEARDLIVEGMSGLNGLTDGWAYFLKHLALIKNKYESSLPNEEAKALNQIYNRVYKIVTRS